MNERTTAIVRHSEGAAQTRGSFRQPPATSPPILASYDPQQRPSSSFTTPTAPIPASIATYVPIPIIYATSPSLSTFDTSVATSSQQLRTTGSEWRDRGADASANVDSLHSHLFSYIFLVCRTYLIYINVLTLSTNPQTLKTRQNPDPYPHQTRTRSQGTGFARVRVGVGA